jgi:hypothetical protein
MASTARPYRGEKGLGPEHGISLFGPCTREKIELEFARLTETFASIKAHGYLPDRFGDITGYFLLDNGQFRFVVRGGKHRAAALAAMGRTHLPVRLKPGWVPVVSLDTLAEWPLVQTGGIAAPAARRVFERYFEWDGTQQYRQSYHEPAHERCGRFARDPVRRTGDPAQSSRHRSFPLQAYRRGSRHCAWPIPSLHQRGLGTLDSGAPGEVFEQHRRKARLPEPQGATAGGPARIRPAFWPVGPISARGMASGV